MSLIGDINGYGGTGAGRNNSGVGGNLAINRIQRGNEGLALSGRPCGEESERPIRHDREVGGVRVRLRGKPTARLSDREATLSATGDGRPRQRPCGVPGIYQAARGQGVQLEGARQIRRAEIAIDINNQVGVV